jgi:hypothetical protein
MLKIIRLTLDWIVRLGFIAALDMNKLNLSLYAKLKANIPGERLCRLCVWKHFRLLIVHRGFQDSADAK